MPRYRSYMVHPTHDRVSRYLLSDSRRLYDHGPEGTAGADLGYGHVSDYASETCRPVRLDR